MKGLAVGLLSAVALATTILLVRQQKDSEHPRVLRPTPAGETVPSAVSLQRMRELGL